MQPILFQDALQFSCKTKLMYVLVLAFVSSTPEKEISYSRNKTIFTKLCLRAS